MSTKKLFRADPFNDEHIKLFEEFERENNEKKPITIYLNDIRKTNNNNKEEYLKREQKSNELNDIAFTKDENRIIDYCYIRGEKDLKLCELFFAQLKSNQNNRPIMQLVSEYVFDIMGMEEVYVSLTDEKEKLYSQLINQGYQDIGDVNGKITLAKGKKEDILI